MIELIGSLYISDENSGNKKYNIVMRIVAVQST